MKICIPTLDNLGFDSRVSPHFGQAAWFAIVDDESNSVEFVSNSGKHHGGSMTPAELIMQQNVQTVICGGLGVKAVRLLAAANICVYRDAAGTIQETLDAYHADRLPLASDANACQGHHHH